MFRKLSITWFFWHYFQYFCLLSTDEYLPHTVLDCKVLDPQATTSSYVLSEWFRIAEEGTDPSLAFTGETPVKVLRHSNVQAHPLVRDLSRLSKRSSLNRSHDEEVFAGSQETFDGRPHRDSRERDTSQDNIAQSTSL